MAGAQQSYWQVLRNGRLATLLAGDAISKIGDGMSFVALPLLALQLHGAVEPALAISLVTAAPHFLPIAVSLFFGLGRRRFNPRTVLLVDAVVRSATFIGLGLLALAGSPQLWSLTAVLIAGSMSRLLSASSRRLIATSMLGEDSRLAVNGLIGTSDSLALYVAGPALGGLLAALTSSGLVLLINGISYVGLLVAGVLAVPVMRATGKEARGRPSEAVSGWMILMSTPVALRLFLVVFLFNLFYGPVEVALPLLVTDALNADSRALGVLWTSFGLGALCGALLINQLRRFSQRGLLVSIIGGWAASLCVLSATSTITIAAAALAVGGIVYGPFVAIAYTVLQETQRQQDQQPVFTLWAAGLTAAAPLGLGLAGPLVAGTGSRGGLLVSALVTALLVPASYRWLRTVGAHVTPDCYGPPGC